MVSTTAFGSVRADRRRRRAARRGASAARATNDGERDAEDGDRRSRARCVASVVMRRQILDDPQSSRLELLRSASVSSTYVSPLYWFCSSEKATSSAALCSVEVVVALGGAPGDGAEDAAVLLERHLQMALLQLARAVDDLDAARREDRPRIAGAERRQRRDAGRDAAGDARGTPGRRRSAAAASGRPGPSVSSATSLTAARSSRMRAASSVRPAACLWPPNRISRCAQRSSAPSMSKRGMLRHDPCATPSSTDSTMAGRWNASTSFDATMPMTPRCQPSPATTRTERAPMSGSVWTIFFAGREDLGFLLLALDVLAVELQRERAHLLAPAPRRSASSSRVGDVGRAHAAGGVDARRQHERDVIAVDRLAGQAADVEQRAQADLVRPARQQVEAELRDHAVLADERHDVGQRADGGDLDEARQPACRGRRAGRAPAPASARRRRRRGTCPDSVQSCRFGLITASAGGSSASGSWWSVMIRSTPSSRARRAASAPRMPQSTEMMSATPSACSRSIAAGCRP